MSSINSDDLHRIFNKLDKNNDGQVSIEELEWLLDRIGAHTCLIELKTIVGNKTLTFTDFWIFYELFIERRRACDQSKTVEDEERGEENKLEKDLVKAFQVFDMNRDGFISCEELESTLSRLGLWEGQSCTSMIEFYDTNADGLLDFDEFKKMMLVTNS